LMKLTPLTTRPSATSRQGMMRLARPMGWSVRIHSHAAVE
jgi:hypothetical protein